MKGICPGSFSMIHTQITTNQHTSPDIRKNIPRETLQIARNFDFVLVDATFAPPCLGMCAKIHRLLLLLLQWHHPPVILITRVAPTQPLNINRESRLNVKATSKETEFAHGKDPLVNVNAILAAQSVIGTIAQWKYCCSCHRIDSLHHLHCIIPVDVGDVHTCRQLHVDVPAVAIPLMLLLLSSLQWPALVEIS